MAPALRTIINKELAATGCTRILAGDGITSSDFTIKTMPGILDGIALDARDAKKALPSMGGIMSTAKNMDEYYFKICNLVRTLPDSEVKVQLQKYRVGIVASFSSLTSTLHKKSYQELPTWDKNAKSILESSIEMFIAASNPNMKRFTKSRDSFAYFGVPEDAVEASLRSAYGMG